MIKGKFFKKSATLVMAAVMAVHASAGVFASSGRDYYSEFGNVYADGNITYTINHGKVPKYTIKTEKKPQAFKITMDIQYKGSGETIDHTWSSPTVVRTSYTMRVFTDQYTNKKTGYKDGFVNTPIVVYSANEAIGIEDSRVIYLSDTY